jgi:hypothetical protein
MILSTRLPLAKCLLDMATSRPAKNTLKNDLITAFAHWTTSDRRDVTCAPAILVFRIPNSHPQDFRDDDQW